MPTSPSHPKRIALLGGLALVCLLVALGIWRSMHANTRELQRIAASLMPCPADHIEVVDSDSSDTAEVHHVRGCGMAATMICSAPDFECVLAPSDRPATKVNP